MKKISQAIIGATLILDVAVVFTFGLAIISSFEDGSRLPETTFARKSSEGRVAGEMTSTCPSVPNLKIEMPAEGAAVTTSPFGIHAVKIPGTTLPTLTSVRFVPTATAYQNIPATYTQVNMSWVADVSITAYQIQNGPFSFRAEGFDNQGNCIARSDSRHVAINYNSSINLLTPVVNITSPQSGDTLSGAQAIVVGEITNLPAGTQIQDALIKIFNNGTQVAGPFSAPALDANNYLTRQSIFNSTALNGVYDVKMFVHYAGTDSLLKFIESAPTTINIDNAITTSTNTSYNQNVNSGADTNSSTNYNSNISNTNTTATNTNVSTSTSGTNTNSTTLTNTSTETSGSTDTTTPPPAGTTAMTLTVAITNPAPSTTPVILRSKDNPLAAKTSAAVSGLRFNIHKADEPADWFRMIDAIPSANKINWTGKLDLIDFKNGDYDITAVAKTGLGEVLSKPILIAVQKFGFNWINPQSSQTPQILSGAVPIKVKINGIYEKDGMTAAKGVKVYFYQTNTQSPYSEIYNEQLYQSSGTQEWRLYDWALKKEKLWNTKNSSNGKYRLLIKVINESISTSNIWFPTEPIFIEINNQQAVSTSNNANTSMSGANNNQNINAAATNTAASNSSNIAAAENTNAVNNTNIDSAQNVNTANDLAVAAVQGDSDQDGLIDEDERTRGTDPSSVDTDKDGLIDFEEIDKYGTDPLKNDTDGDGYLDGEEVQSLHDPLKPPTDPTAAVLTKPKPIEEPKASEKPILESLVIEKIGNKEIKTTPPPSMNETNSQASTSETTENTIVLKGKGPANTILTLFIYSEDPIVVTVRTNENGEWIYELDKTLEDGEHEVYATITDDTGKIESTSSPMRFLVKQARAETIPERADTGIDSVPGSSSTNLYLLISGIMVFIAIVAGFIIALRRKRGDTNQMT